MLAAGLKGVEEGYELPPESEDDVWTMSRRERRAMGYTDLPGNLEDALDAMEESELVAEALGEHVFEFFLRNKRREWADYRRHITPLALRGDASLGRRTGRAGGSPARGGSGCWTAVRTSGWAISAGTPTTRSR